MERFNEYVVQAYQQHLWGKGIAPNSIDTAMERLRILVRLSQSSGRALTEIDREQIQSLLIAMVRRRPPLSGCTVNGRLKQFRAFYRFLIESNLADRDPTQGIPLMPVRRRVKQLVSPEDFSRVIAAVRKRRTFYALRNECLLTLAYDTMLRLTELLTLSVGQVRLFPHRLIEVEGKGSKQRIVSFGQQTAGRMLIYLSRRAKERIPGDVLFPTRDGRRITKRNAQHIFERCGRLAEPPVKLSPHMFRRGGATLMRQLTGDIQLVRDILGHESIVTTELYTGSSQLHILSSYNVASPVDHAFGTRRK